MSNSATLRDLFENFADALTKSDVYAIKAMADVSVALMKKRIELEMNQKTFAEYLGVSQGMVSRWENGEYNFTIKSIAELCEKIGCTFTLGIEKEESASVPTDERQPYVTLLPKHTGGIAPANESDWEAFAS